jgi:hypothetical protein
MGVYLTTSDLLCIGKGYQNDFRRATSRTRVDQGGLGAGRSHHRLCAHSSGEMAGPRTGVVYHVDQGLLATSNGNRTIISFLLMNGSSMPTSSPTFIECSSNSLYIYLDYATFSTLLCFHAAYHTPPPRHLNTLVFHHPFAMPLPGVAPLSTASCSNGSFGGLLSEDLPTSQAPPPFPLFLRLEIGSTIYSR